MPPPILLFSAYQGTDPSGNPNKLGRSGIQDVPVVITNLSIEWTDDVDYIPSKYNAPVPIIQTISLTLLETHTPANISTFNINDFANGKMLNY